MSHLFRNEAVSRRSFLQSAALTSAGLAALLAGCQPSQSGSVAPSGSTGGTISSGGSLKYGGYYPGQTLDPNSTALNPSEYYALYDTLVRMTPDAKFVEGLAKSWELDKNDQTKWIFHLRDAEWSDGKPFTSEDVKFSYEYIKDPANKSALISRVDTVDHVETPDKNTAVIVTKNPDPILPRRSFLVFIQPKHYMTDPSKGPQAMATQPVGTGAYVIDKYQQGSLIALKKNPNSWRGTKGLDNVEMRIITEPTTRLSAFESGAVDFMEAVPRAEAQRVKAMPHTMTAIPAATGYIGFDLDYFDKPFADKNVRLAMAHAIDQDAILKNVYFGYGEIMQGQMLTSKVFGHNPNLKPYGYDPAKAKQLLAQAGYPNGFKTQMEYLTGTDPEQKRFAEASASYFKAIGVDCDITPIELNVWRDGLYGRRKRAPVFYNTWSAFAVLEASFALQWMATENPGKYYANEEFNTLYHQALKEMDDKKREELYWKAVAVMHDDPPGLWIVASPGIVAYNTDKIAHYDAMPGPTIYFDQTQLKG